MTKRLKVQTETRMPAVVVQEVFAWIHPRSVLKYQRLATDFCLCLRDPIFALLNLQHFIDPRAEQTAANIRKLDEFDSLWFRWPRFYQRVYAIFRLQHLVKLDWRGINAVQSRIPKAIGFLENITHLNLASARLTGPIPREIGRLVTLEHLALHWNQLDGSIPADIGNLINLKHLSLADNNLDGPIPASIGYLGQLESLDVSNNRLEGTIPSEIGKLKRITRLYLQNNKLRGLLPDEISQLSHLRELNVYENLFERWIIPSSVTADLPLYSVLRGIGFYNDGENRWR